MFNIEETNKKTHYFDNEYERKKSDNLSYHS